MFLFNIIILNDGVAIQPDWPFYCPQVIPDYTINYTVTSQFTLVNYCPQTIPDYTINYTVTSQFTLVNYCPQTIPDYSFAQAP